ncbi:Hypothetical protein I595_1025 [Croceitalea dokdonensis DOKDO 023]|uniref:Uncharacterized protein n=1 Tax=Croceitalea dokdonensis DOKDO 023 TaxID=1300341 RepID=A0A0P7AGL9_9FLAO|nr:Hypothetical protein I595_1025 [Croceitalea dokdonensis DOKDO 023]
MLVADYQGSFLIRKKHCKKDWLLFAGIKKEYLYLHPLCR